MKTMIKFSLILSLLCLFAVPSYAQGQKTTMDILTSTVWGGEKEIFHPLVKKHYFFYRKFDDKNMSVLSVYSDGTREESITPYYLSNTPERKFDQSKVGKAKNGKYLIIGHIDIRGRLIEHAACFELLEIAPEKFIWKAHYDNVFGSITVERSPVDPWKEKDK